MRWTCYLTKNREKPYWWLQAPYQKCTAMFLWTSLPSFSKSTQREIQLLLWKKGYPLINSKHYCPCQITAFLKPLSWTKEDALFRRWALERAFKYSLLMVTVPRYPKWRWLMGEGPFVAIIQGKKGSSWLQVILLSYGLFRTESVWGVGSIHSMKSTAGFSFYHSPDILE